MRANTDVRETAKEKGVFLWEVADRLGLHDSNFSRLLRKELPNGKKREIFGIIDELSREGTKNG